MYNQLIENIQLFMQSILALPKDEQAEIGYKRVQQWAAALTVRVEKLKARAESKALDLQKEQEKQAVIGYWVAENQSEKDETKKEIIEKTLINLGYIFPVEDPKKPLDVPTK